MDGLPPAGSPPPDLPPPSYDDSSKNVFSAPPPQPNSGYPVQPQPYPVQQPGGFSTQATAFQPTGLPADQPHVVRGTHTSTCCGINSNSPGQARTVKIVVAVIAFIIIGRVISSIVRFFIGLNEDLSDEDFFGDTVDNWNEFVDPGGDVPLDESWNNKQDWN